MLFVLDNYDSFTYNLVQYLGELGEDPVVYRNDALSVADVEALKPTAVVLSPGPKTPAQAGILVPLVRALAGQVPILGVCLGHQAIGEAFGGKIVRAPRLMHGKTCPIVHSDDELFDGIPSPFTAMRYHSLVVEPASLPPALVVTAMSADRQGAGDAADHGDEASRSSDLWRAIPSGVHRDGAREANSRELPARGASCGVRGSSRLCR